MSMGTNLLLIVVAFNLLLFIFGEPDSCSPVLGIVSAWLSGADIVSIMVSYGNALAIYAILIGVIAAASFATGANYLTTGGGHGAVLALQVLGIAIFSALALFPNFATLGFPSLIGSGIPLLEGIQIVFGALLTVTVIEMLRGR